MPSITFTNLSQLFLSKFIAQFGNTGFEPQSETVYTQGAGLDPIINVVVFLSNLIGIITIMGGLFFIVYFFIGAFNWITGSDDSGKVEKARQRMINGILGLIVLVLSYSLVGIVSKILGIDIINLYETLGALVPGVALPAP